MVWGKIDNPEEEPKYTDDDGLFDKGERAQKHYDEMFSPKEAEQTLSVLKRIEKRRVLSLLLRIM